MSSGYVRQSAANISTGLVINADDFNAEYNQIQAAFDGSSGHDHTGGTGLGQKIGLTNAVTGILPSTNGGTGSAFVTFTGPTVPRTYTLPDSNATFLTTASILGVASGGTGLTAGSSGGLLYFSGVGTIASSTALGANQILLGAGVGLPPASLSLGTSTTVLHGNASGAPTWGAVSLTGEVSGILPVANGGTGVSALTSISTIGTITTGVWQGTKIGLTYGGTNTDLSATGGTSQVLKQTSVGGNVSVGQLSVADLTTAVTGTGSIVLASSPTLVTPTLGAALATTLNKVTITAPAASATLTIANLKTLTCNNTLTFVGTDSTTITFQGTDTYVGRATTDTLTNKTFDTAGTGNTFKVNGTSITAIKGSTSTLATVTGAVTSTHIATWDASGNLQDGGAPTSFSFASQSDMETATSTTVAVNPAVAQYHPSAAKAWAVFDGTAGSPTAAAGYNIASITKNGTGDFTVTFTTAFSSANYAIDGTVSGPASFTRALYVAEDHLPTASTCRFYTANSSSGAGVDCTRTSVFFYGDQ